MLDLKWDSTSASCNYGLAFVNRFRNLDFEPLAGRKLYDEFGAGKNGIEDYTCDVLVPWRLVYKGLGGYTLITWPNSHNHDILPNFVISRLIELL